MMNLSKFKLMVIGCLSMVTIAGVVNVPSATAAPDDYFDSQEDNRGYEYGRDRADEHRGVYHGRKHRRYCRELKESIYSLEATRERILRRNHYNPERLHWVEQELRQKRFEYRRACR